MARPLILGFALVALGASLASLYVHYRMLADPSYVSFCNINETVSCEAVYESEYGTAFGVPVAAGGVVWSGLVALLAFAGLGGPKPGERSATIGALIFVLSVIGLATVFYFGYASFVVLQKACVLCMTVYAAVIGTFVVASNVGGPLSALPARLSKDLSSTFRAPLAATLALVWLVGSVGLVAFFPRGAATTVSDGTGPQEPAVPVETLDAAQVAEWAKWLDSQPQADEVKPTGDVKVLVLKFNDYQCPACRQTYSLYKGIIEKYEAAYPGVFKFETRDYPLETECGFGGIHGAACEAAVAVRLAREQKKDKELEAALFSRQSPTMTREDVKAALEEVTKITDFDARYAEVLPAVRADAQLGQRLKVDGTPTFFINGVKLGSLRPAYFDAAIAHALRKAGVQVAAS